MNKNSVIKYLFLQAKVCFGWCIEAEYHVQMFKYIVIDQIVNTIIDGQPTSKWYIYSQTQIV